jgi:hypothetical protein
MKKYIFLLFLGISFTLNAQFCLLVDLISKEQTEWCGIASTKCVLKYYGFDYLQCQIAEHVRTNCPWNSYGGYNCCSNPTGYCNSPTELVCMQDILLSLGNISTGPDPKPLPDWAISWNLELNRPLIMRWENIAVPTHGHAMVIHGIEEDDGSVYDYSYIISVMNPDPYPDGGYKEYYYEDLLYFYIPETKITFKWEQTIIPYSSPIPAHCRNGIFEPGLGETGVDCGGPCPPCAPPPPPPDPTKCSNCQWNHGEQEIDCGGACNPCKDLPKEIIIDNLVYGSPYHHYEVMATNSITAKEVKIESGKKVSYFMEETGSIVLRPGFRAQKGSNFVAQLKDLSKYSRACPDTLCNCVKASSVVYCRQGYQYRQYFSLYDLLYATKIEYKIRDEQGQFIYSDTIDDITRNGTFHLYKPPCTEGFYWFFGTIYYCNGMKSYIMQKFFVSESFSKGKSSTDEPDEPENHNSFLSFPLNNILPQTELPPRHFSILPNPNPSAFQIETNFPLSEIANLKITNSLGGIVYETQNPATNAIQMPASASGLHFVVIILKDGSVLTQKMMIQ